MMTTEKLIQAARACAELVRKSVWWDPAAARVDASKNGADLTAVEKAGHLFFMCEEIERMVRGADAERTLVDMPALIEAGDERRSAIEKAMRWLGFVQGALWAGGSATIEELKRMNMPDEEK
jgi:hypothetical protein